ncbi:hypothetical protein FA95DRAFT_1349067 [Auriscalpium vulgare]|uniref:Uncharacterized protein n=1 Tax=Auriscalpium vulgare TaxID=40419 RepID=A0ACB8R1X7_9AGAM|nr:hypothetical protein FA95DRAFT_1349067 [Auriscalpium vulgare]
MSCRSGAQLPLGMYVWNCSFNRRLVGRGKALARSPPTDHVARHGPVRHGELATAHFTHEVAVPSLRPRRAVRRMRRAQSTLAVPLRPHVPHPVHRPNDPRAYPRH